MYAQNLAGNAPHFKELAATDADLALRTAAAALRYRRHMERNEVSGRAILGPWAPHMEAIADFLGSVSSASAPEAGPVLREGACRRRRPQVHRLAA